MTVEEAVMNFEKPEAQNHMMEILECLDGDNSCTEHEQTSYIISNVTCV